MPRDRTASLFGDPADEPEPEPSSDAPLAERMRPRALEEYVGQAHLLGPGKFVRRAIESGGRLPSMIFWGGPGTGKTTLARLLARQSKARFVPVSAVHAGVKELREAIEGARSARRQGRSTVLFVDEIHRFNKAQQDALLPAVEDGTVTLLGATTENPSFEVNGALLSRARVLTLQALSESDLESIAQRALDDPERGLGALKPVVSPELMAHLARASGGDARVALSALEAAVLATDPDEAGVRRVEESTLVEALGRARFAYDKGGEEHYNLASALVLR